MIRVLDGHKTLTCVEVKELFYDRIRDNGRNGMQQLKTQPRIFI